MLLEAQIIKDNRNIQLLNVSNHPFYFILSVWLTLQIYNMFGEIIWIIATSLLKIASFSVQREHVSANLLPKALVKLHFYPYVVAYIKKWIMF